MSAISFNNSYYIIRQSNSHHQTIRILSQLQGWTDVVDLSKQIIEKSLTSEFKDVEVAIQYQSALSVAKLDCIVTRNAKDFKSSTVAIFSPKEVLTFVRD